MKRDHFNMSNVRNPGGGGGTLPNFQQLVSALDKTIRSIRFFNFVKMRGEIDLRSMKKVGELDKKSIRKLIQNA